VPRYAAQYAARYAARQPATVVFTSGSTGEPRAALHPFGALYYSAAGFNDWASVGPGDRWLLSLPLYHVSGLGIVFRCLLAGAAVVLPPAGASLPEAVARYRITRLSLVATQLDRMLRDGGLEALDTLRTLLLGGSAMPPALIREAHRRGLPVCPSYGLTEMSSTVAVARPAEAAADPSASGRVLPYREVGIAPDGEVRVRGRTLFAGYVDGDRLERPVDAEGWYATGDLGVMDRDGRLHLRGRKDNMFISGGENIQPEEVERALCRLPGVVQAVVVPVPVPEYGQRPVAFVEAVADRMEPRRWAEGLERVLPRFKMPIAYYPWPREAMQGLKVSRADLAERATRLRMEPL
jgi:O-succinylbenzoic acid--CoA ligase